MLKIYKNALLILCIGLSLFSCKLTTDAGDSDKPAANYTFSAVSDSHGAVSWTPAGDSFPAGTAITVVASTPAEGYEFKAWSNASGASVSTSNSYTFTITENTVLTATHGAIAPCTLTGSVSGNGSISVQSSATSETSVSKSYIAGTSVTITAVPDAGNQFLRWEGDVSGGAETQTFAITRNMSVTAVFASSSAKVFSVTVVVNPAEAGTVTPGSGKYVENSTITVTAAANAGFKFLNWNGATTAASYTSAPITSNTTITANFLERWLILVHFAIDNNIDYSFEKNYGTMTNYLAALEAVEAADTADVLDICVLMDSYDKSDPSGVSYTSTFTDGYYKLTGGTFSADLKVATGEINSGDVQTTKSFMDWAYENYHGKRLMYSVFNHGSGFDDKTVAGTYGIGFDDSNKDCLTHSELAQTTAYLKAKAGRNIDLFYPYACLMGGVELAWEVRNNADVLLASEETFPAEKWSYEALNAIIANPEISAANLAKAFCDSAYAFFSPMSMDRSFTLAAYDLSKTQGLYDAVNGFALAAAGWIGNDSAKAQKLDDAAAASLYMSTPYSYYTDLGIFMNQVDTLVGGFGTQTAAVLNAINNMIIYKKTFASTLDQAVIDYDDASGISIFHNIWSARLHYSPTTYQNVLAFGATNAWTAYAKKMDDLTILPPPPAKDAYEPDGGSDPINNILTAGLANAQSHTFHDTGTGGDQDFMRVYLTAGTAYTFQTIASSSPSDTCLYLYNTSGVFITTNDDIDFPTNKYSKISYTATATGYHYLCVYDRYCMYGDYKIYFDAGTWGSATGTQYKKWAPEGTWNGRANLNK